MATIQAWTCVWDFATVVIVAASEKQAVFLARQYLSPFVGLRGPMPRYKWPYAKPAGAKWQRMMSGKKIGDVIHDDVHGMSAMRWQEYCERQRTNQWEGWD